MFIELHLLQNFAPSNLNRDDTGAPKDCEFGGYRRARISSQCLKRAIRMEFRRVQYVGERSKRFRQEVAKLLPKRPQSDAENAFDAAMAILGVLSEERGNDGGNDIRTEVLLFLSRAQIDALAAVCEKHWDELQNLHSKLWSSGKRKKPSKKDAKKLGSKALKDDLLRAIDAPCSPDQALFGRMLADLPKKNIDAAAQVAHAISTNKVNVEFDFYTAVDDLRPEETAGADMMGTVEFNSACFYRYANIDVGQLEENLGGDQELTRATVGAFLRASIEAIPTGKQNSMAAHNPPSLIFAVVRDHGLWSLANAFVKPIWPGAGGDLVEQSVAALDTYWHQLTAMYGEQGIRGKWVATLHPEALQHLAGSRVSTVGDLIACVLSETWGGKAGEGGVAA